MPIFFFVGTKAPLLHLSLGLGSDQPLVNIVLQTEALTDLKPPYRAQELASHLKSAIYQKQPVGPYYLGGFSQDAVLAYEVARQLMMHSQTVGLLVLFEPMNPRRSARARIATELRRMVMRVNLHLSDLRRFGLNGFPGYVRGRQQKLKWRLRNIWWRVSYPFQLLKGTGASRELNRISFLAAVSYDPEPLGCPTVIFKCKDWPMLSAGDPHFGWSKWLTGDCETHEVPGDHVGIFSQSNAKVLADRLIACLQKAQQQEKTA
jgi:thioesterase domain-containing protein